MHHIYLSKECARLARRNDLEDDGFREAIDRAEAGTVDADLGGGLIKQRVARRNEGRAKGFRTIIAYRRGSRAVCLHLFPKSRQANLTAGELETFQELAKFIHDTAEAQLDELVARQGWKKIQRNEEESSDLSK